MSIQSVPLFSRKIRIDRWQSIRGMDEAGKHNHPITKMRELLTQGQEAVHHDVASVRVLNGLRLAMSLEIVETSTRYRPDLA
jgi:hypothetical protein